MYKKIVNTKEKYPDFDPSKIYAIRHPIGVVDVLNNHYGNFYWSPIDRLEQQAGMNHYFKLESFQKALNFFIYEREILVFDSIKYFGSWLSGASTKYKVLKPVHALNDDEIHIDDIDTLKKQNNIYELRGDGLYKFKFIEDKYEFKFINFIPQNGDSYSISHSFYIPYDKQTDDEYKLAEEAQDKFKKEINSYSKYYYCETTEDLASLIINSKEYLKVD